jgi:hypothetical protein
MYPAFYDAYNYWIKCIQLDKVKPKYTVEILGKLKENINAFKDGGVYFFDHKNYQLAYQCLNAYVKAGVSEDLKSLKISDDPEYKVVACYECQAALNSGDAKIAISACENAKKFDFQKDMVYRCLCLAYKNDKQNAKFIATLKEGYALFPNNTYFKDELSLIK